LAKKYDVTIPGNWKKGMQVVVPTHVPSEDIKEIYNVEFFIQHQDYLRTINDPGENKKNEKAN
jgi:hypothetical protein